LVIDVHGHAEAGALAQSVSVEQFAELVPQLARVAAAVDRTI
jgi:hypothetical protein